MQGILNWHYHHHHHHCRRHWPYLGLVDVWRTRLQRSWRVGGCGKWLRCARGRRPRHCGCSLGCGEPGPPLHRHGTCRCVAYVLLYWDMLNCDYVYNLRFSIVLLDILDFFFLHGVKGLMMACCWRVCGCFCLERMCWTAWIMFGICGYFVINILS